jgi:hypothetical protein
MARLSLIALLALVPSLASSQTREPASALPYDLAFDTRQFNWSTTLAVSPDGRRVAYDMRQPPADSNLSERYEPNGTPVSSVGSHIFISARGAPATARAVESCARGNCWRESW